MKVNKLVRTKNDRRLIVLQFTEQEFNDIHSCLSMATRVVDTWHRDSPSFRRAVHKMNKLWMRTLKDILNREKQKNENGL